MRVIAALAAAALALPAHAEWTGNVGEDAMTDQKWAGAEVAFGAGAPILVFKCWETGHIRLNVLIGSYNDAASYASSAVVKFRVDKNDPIEITAQPMNVNGDLALSATRDNEANLLPLMWSIFEGKDRVAMLIGNFVHQTGLRGTSKAFGTMFKVCGLPTGQDAEPQSHPAETPKLRDADNLCDERR